MVLLTKGIATFHFQFSNLDTIDFANHQKFIEEKLKEKYLGKPLNDTIIWSIDKITFSKFTEVKIPYENLSTKPIENITFESTVEFQYHGVVVNTGVLLQGKVDLSQGLSLIKTNLACGTSIAINTSDQNYKQDDIVFYYLHDGVKHLAAEKKTFALFDNSVMLYKGIRSRPPIVFAISDQLTDSSILADIKSSYEQKIPEEVQKVYDSILKITPKNKQIIQFDKFAAYLNEHKHEVVYAQRIAVGYGKELIEIVEKPVKSVKVTAEQALLVFRTQQCLEYDDMCLIMEKNALEMVQKIGGLMPWNVMIT